MWLALATDGSPYPILLPASKILNTVSSLTVFYEHISWLNKFICG